MIIEWNHHLFSRDAARYPWHPRATYIPDENQQHNDPLAAYLQRMRDEGIDRAVIVQPEPYGDDHSLALDALALALDALARALDALAREPDRLRASSLFYPKDLDARRKLEALVKRQPRIVATRFHAHRGKEMYLDSFRDPGVHALWEKAAELGLIVELHIGPNYAQQVRELIETFPHTPVLVDHLCEPAYGTIAEYADALALAELPNVTMKLSGIDHIAEDAPLFTSARRLTKLVADTFGPDCVAWGGESPQVIRAHLSHWPQADVDKALGGNLARLLKWDS